MGGGHAVLRGHVQGPGEIGDGDGGAGGACGIKHLQCGWLHRDAAMEAQWLTGRFVDHTEAYRCAGGGQIDQETSFELGPDGAPIDEQRPELCFRGQGDGQIGHLGADGEVGGGLRLAVGGDAGGQRGGVDQSGGHRIGGTLADLQLHGGWFAHVAVGPNETAPGQIVGIGHFARIDGPRGRYNCHIKFGVSLDRDKARLVGDTLGNGKREGEGGGRSFRRGDGQLGVDGQVHRFIGRFTQHHAPDPIAGGVEAGGILLDGGAVESRDCQGGGESGGQTQRHGTGAGLFDREHHLQTGVDRIAVDREERVALRRKAGLFAGDGELGGIGVLFVAVDQRGLAAVQAVEALLVGIHRGEGCQVSGTRHEIILRVDGDGPGILRGPHDAEERQVERLRLPRIEPALWDMVCLEDELVGPTG